MNEAKLELFSDAARSLVIEAVESNATDEACAAVAVALATLLAMAPERLAAGRVALLLTQTIPGVREDLDRLKAAGTAKALISRVMQK